MYEDFYDDYSPFDEEVDLFKDALKKCVKEEILNKMDRLEKENKELHEIKTNWIKLQAEVNEEKRKLKEECTRVENKIRHENMQKILSFFLKNELLYSIQMVNVLPDKTCGKCNDDRYFIFTSPLGKKYKEPCPECRSPKTKLVIREINIEMLDRVWLSNRNSNLGVEYYLRPRPNSEYNDSECLKTEKIFKTLDSAIKFYKEHDNFYYGLSNIYFDNKLLAEQFLEFLKSERTDMLAPDDWNVINE